MTIPLGTTDADDVHARRCGPRSPGPFVPDRQGRVYGSVVLTLCAFTQCCPTHLAEGTWRHPDDGTSEGYKSLRYWVDVARTLERGGFDLLFFADVEGFYDVWKGSRDDAVRHAAQVPCNDPALLVPALAAATTHLCFAVTLSTTNHVPYRTARLFSTLDHLCEGRVGWNVVTSYLPDSEANGYGRVLDHDERYDRAEEYLEVLYGLWERSWDDDAVVRDVGADVHTDPSKVRTVDHHGRWFDVRGPHLCEPSPQRTPLLLQAGASDRGRAFAARHAEAVFVVGNRPSDVAAVARDLRARAARFGRAPEEIMVLAGVRPVVGVDDETAQRHWAAVDALRSVDGTLARFCGYLGIDLAAWPDDTPVLDVPTQAVRSILASVTGGDGTMTVAQARERIAMRGGRADLCGSPTTVADEIERWVAEGDLDGFLFMPVVQPRGFTELSELLLPELQRRGLHRRPDRSEPVTARERLFGPGAARLAPSHPGRAGVPG
jgi:FMN-dependent oxidoreductase (nitrilotriacetate monooxygenase family)